MEKNFGPMIGRLAKNGIDLRKMPIEVSPIAHYHMGGIRVDKKMATRISGLFAAGEAVGGANGATRLSGNAIPEAFVFGERAGRFAAQFSKGVVKIKIEKAMIKDKLPQPFKQEGKETESAGAASLMTELQDLMWKNVGLFRTEQKLKGALVRIKEMQKEDIWNIDIPNNTPFNQALLDWYELRAGLLCAESVALSAINRKESRGAHQREDLPDASPKFELNQTIELKGDRLISGWAAVPRISFDLEKKKLAKL